MAGIDYQITVVDTIGNWKKATAPLLVRDLGVPLSVAMKWQRIRRSMSPAGLKRKIAATQN